MMIFPSDHFVSDETTFIRHGAILSRFVERQPDWLVLLGVCPTGPEPDLGWIQPGERMAAAGAAPIFRIRRFVEKPSIESARAFWAAGALWNTFVVAGSVKAFIEAGRECVPLLEERLGRASAFRGPQEERWALGQAYALAPAANFSRSVLQMTTKPLAVAQMPDVGWHDLGTPARVLRMVRQLGVTPSWASALDTAS
jgi:mannose-1-phosphate guanylyltransferase